jgi:hypothetical protein
MLILLYKHEHFHSTIEIFLELTLPTIVPYTPKLKVMLLLMPIFREGELRPNRHHHPYHFFNVQYELYELSLQMVLTNKPTPAQLMPKTTS